MSADEKTRIQPAYVPTDVGTQLSGIYELDMRLGSGGMGEVWRGHNIQTGDLVAIKIVLPEFARDQTILSLFRKEASILNHLSHEAVVRYHVFTIDPTIGRPYLAMEFVDGDSLFDVMRNGPMPPDDVRKLCHRLASGLDAVHQAGAIHRDLSPDNIILPGGSVERAKIIDFGIARSANVGGETLIGGRFAGKYNYVSPEQLGLFGGEVSERSDIYSLGLVLAAALRGKPLDMNGSQFEVVEKRRSLADLSGIDGDMRSVLEAMLQPDPAARTATMGEIARMTRSGLPIEREEGYYGAATVPPPAPTSAPRVTSGPEPPAASPSILPGRPEAGGGFVEHVRPALPSKPRPAPSPHKPTQAPKTSAGTSRNIVIATAVVLVTVAGAGAWLGGLLPPWFENREPPAGTISTLMPEPSTQVLEPSAAERDPPPPPKADFALPQPESLPGSDLPDQMPEIDALERVQDSAPPAGEINSAQQIIETLVQQTRKNGGLPITAKNRDAEEDTVGPVIEARLHDQPRPNGNDQPAGRSDEPRDQGVPPQTSTPEAEPAEAPNGLDDDAPPGDTQPSRDPRAEDRNNDLTPPPFEEVETQETRDPDPGEEQASNAIPDNAEASEFTTDEKPPAEEAAEPENDRLALYVPKPEVPQAGGVIAQRAAWLRAFEGGDCFFATPIEITENAVRVEGFATSVDPFEKMLEAFESRFGLEPDFEVRLINTAQCAVPRFMRNLRVSSAKGPELIVDQMSIPSGGTLSGTLRTAGDMRTSLLLIDHAGMVFSLDPALVPDVEKAAFSVPINLDAGDNSAGNPLPELLIAISGASDLQAARFNEPIPASVLLPRILTEISDTDGEFSVTTKYFEIGG